ncbi:MAG: sensor histidine kinase [Solirubrobacteraceae bacterium]
MQLVIEGEPCRVPRGIDLTAFRVVQEALTNTLKHAGPASAQVTVRYAPSALELEISDTGRGPGRTLGSSKNGGHGLVGMRERVILYGGDLRASKRRGGGFQVVARIPISEAPAA